MHTSLMKNILYSEVGMMKVLESERSWSFVHNMWKVRRGGGGLGNVRNVHCFGIESPLFFLVP